MLVPPDLPPAPPTSLANERGDLPARARISSWDDLAADEPLPGVTVQVVHGDQQTLIRYCYQPGSVYPVHSHPQEQITIVVRGRIAFDLSGERQTLGPGQVVVIPGGVSHGATVIGDEAVETLNTLSPRRTLLPIPAASPRR